jgi:hypothetical protein
MVFPGIEKHLDIAYALRDSGWNCLYFHFVAVGDRRERIRSQVCPTTLTPQWNGPCNSHRLTKTESS